MHATLRRLELAPQRLHVRPAQEDLGRAAGHHRISEPGVEGVGALAQLAHDTGTVDLGPVASEKKGAP